ncbi:MAG: molybdopterin-guanine dinucleotide biosynthesis protein B [Candidatus Aminicenantes bacterium]
MNIIAFVGRSGTGKTTLVGKLVRELKSRGLSVAAVKHAPHGFSLDEKKKDSGQFIQAGADGVMVVSPDGMVLQRKRKSQELLADLICRYFSSMDWVLLEGGKHEPGIPKIEVLKKKVSEEPVSGISDRIAMAADFKIEAPVPVFHSGDISGMAGFLEEKMKKKMSVKLVIDGQNIPMNAFVQSIFSSTLQGMIAVLSGIPQDLETVEIKHRAGLPPDLRVNHQAVPMNEFVQKYYVRVIRGMTASLDDVPEEPESIDIELS